MYVCTPYFVAPLALMQSRHQGTFRKFFLVSQFGECASEHIANGIEKINYYQINHVLTKEFFYRF